MISILCNVFCAGGLFDNFLHLLLNGKPFNANKVFGLLMFWMGMSVNIAATWALMRSARRRMEAAEAHAIAVPVFKMVCSDCGSEGFATEKPPEGFIPQCPECKQRSRPLH